jgi:hypothetical protein
MLAQARRDNPGGVVLIADSLDPMFVSLFDGASTYNITGHTRHKSPPVIRAWAHTPIPGWSLRRARKDIDRSRHPYDDRNVGRPPPRPIADRWVGRLTGCCGRRRSPRRRITS